MDMHYRQGDMRDFDAIKQLAITSWTPFKEDLTTENWAKLSNLLNSDDTFLKLIEQSHCILCETADQKVVGMAFIVSSGNPTDLFDEKWSYIRFVSVDPSYGGQGVGRILTQKCMDYAKQNGEQTVALHTSEMMAKARHIYESMGFEILREIEPRLGKRYWVYTKHI